MSYSYQSSSYSSGGYGGDAFSQADANQDGRVDLGEFRNFVGQNAGAGVGLVGGALGGGYGSSSSYESSSTVVGGGAYDASAALVGGGLVGGGLVSGGVVGGGVYDASSAVVGGGAYDSSAVLLGGGVSNVGVATSQWATDAQGLFQDPNPQIIRRPAAGGVQTYTQNIRVKFLQPPPLPPPGPLIIREVRPPQPPAPPPLKITQRAPALPTPPPLVLRERPPVAPAVLGSQTRIVNLPALPVPPRSVITERYAAAPARPRDIIIERWIPYGAQAKRQTIRQRAGAAVQYAAPRNIIYQYEAPQVRVVRNFQRLGVTSFSPAAYLQQYGASLLDAATLVQQARAAGVVEDITPPGFVGSAAGSSVVSSGSSWGAGAELVGVGGGLVEGGLVGGGLGGASYSQSSEYVSGGLGGGSYSSSSSSEYVSGGSLGGGVVGAGGLLGNVADAAFTAGDLNANGTLDRSEFTNLVSGGGFDHNLSTLV